MARKSPLPNMNRRVSNDGDTAVYISVGTGRSRIRATGGRPPDACYVRAAVPSRDAILRRASAASAAVALALVSACGGGERQDAGEDPATYPVEVVRASFPDRQRLAERSELRIAVRNVGERTIPNLAVTIATPEGGTETEAFGRLADEADLSSRSRPVWIVDEGPGETAYANTWALGPLRPNRTATFAWRLAAVRAGRYALTWQLAGSLTGGARLRREDGRVPRGRFDVVVDRRPAKVTVTAGGKVRSG